MIFVARCPDPSLFFCSYYGITYSLRRASCLWLLSSKLHCQPTSKIQTEFPLLRRRSYLLNTQVLSIHRVNQFDHAHSWKCIEWLLSSSCSFVFCNNDVWFGDNGWPLYFKSIGHGQLKTVMLLQEIQYPNFWEYTYLHYLDPRYILQ